MTAAGAIQRRHLPDGGVQWLRLKPGCAPLGDAPHVVPLHRHGYQNCQQLVCIFVVVDSLLPTTMAK
jgi:hypothetical protein